jgi:hypothetical protein
MRRTGIRLAVLLACLLGVAVFAASAQAQLSVESFETTTTNSQAGGHPDLRTSFQLGGVGNAEVPRDIAFDLPVGYFGNPKVLTNCSSRDYALEQCPPNAQVGLITIRAEYEGQQNFLLGTAPIFSVEPTSENEAARFAFIVPKLDIPIAIPVTVRSATDYGLRFTVSGITQRTPLTAADLTFWGFPAATTHTPERFPKGAPGNPSGCPEEVGTGCIATGVVASVPLRPFTGNPSVCGAPEPTFLSVVTYQRPAAAVSAGSSYPPIEECERQTFSPLAQAELTSKEIDSPSGMDLRFAIPQAQTLAASPSSLRAVTLRLPEELTINPDAADGQSACSDSDAEIGVEVPAHCPDNAKVGTVKMTSESLPGALEGSIYFGEPRPGNQYRLLLIADGFGIHVKLEGKLLPDPSTGRLFAEFQNLPQLPLENFEVHLFASDRGVFATPTHCAIYAVETDLFPWNSALADQRGRLGLSLASGPGGSKCPSRRRSRPAPRTRKRAPSAASP